MFARWCLLQIKCMLNWLHITVTTSWYITSVTQLENLPWGQRALLGWELWPHSKVILLNYVHVVFLKYSSALGTDRSIYTHSQVKGDLFTLIDHIPGCGSLMLTTLAELGMCRSSVRPSFFPISFPRGQTWTWRQLFIFFAVLLKYE